MPTVKQNLLNGINQTTLAVNDSRGRPEPGRWARILPGLVAAQLPNIRIVMKERNVLGQGTVVTVLQAGAPGAATWTYIVDAVSGATSFRFDYVASSIGVEHADDMIVLTGVNDAIKYYVEGNASYHPQQTYINFVFLCNWMFQTYGTKAHLMTDGWLGTSLFQHGRGLAYFQAAIRRASRMVQGPCDLIETAHYFEDNCNGTGFAGQNGFFAYPDDAHWLAPAEPGIAALCMPALGF